MFKLGFLPFVYERGDECLKVHHGDAVFWEKDEWHETKTKTGLTAIVIESDELNTSALMLKLKQEES